MGVWDEAGDTEIHTTSKGEPEEVRRAGEYAKKAKDNARRIAEGKNKAGKPKGK